LICIFLICFLHQAELASTQTEAELRAQLFARLPAKRKAEATGNRKDLQGEKQAPTEATEREQASCLKKHRATKVNQENRPGTSLVRPCQSVGTERAGTLGWAGGGGCHALVGVGGSDLRSVGTQGAKTLALRPEALVADMLLRHFREGFIFKCSAATIAEVQGRSLFGAEPKLWPLVQQSVFIGTTALFLYNYTTRTLEGVFVAIQKPTMNLEPEAWNASGLKRTSLYGSVFPAQVRVRKITSWPPVAVARWANALTWVSGKDFVQTLSKEQVLFLLASIRP
jgi:hypothetical protein